MADEVVLSIGLPNQPADTIYTYSQGQVTLSARPAVQRTPAELRVIVARIGAFVGAVQAGGHPPDTTANVPHLFRLDVTAGNPAVFEARFRSGTLTVTAELNQTTRVTAFDARPQRTVAWSDFTLFVAWMQALLYRATR